MLMKKMSLHVDLRLTVAVFGAALCPPWTALGVLQVGLVSPVIRYSAVGRVIEPMINDQAQFIF